MRNFVLLGLLLLTVASFPSRAGLNYDPTFIVNSKVDRTEDLVREDLIRIFTLDETRWDDGNPITVIVYPSRSPQMRTFLQGYLGLTPYQYKKKVERMIYRGYAQPPIKVNNEEEMFNKIKSVDYAIGFTYSSIIIKDEDGIKIIDLSGM